VVRASAVSVVPAGADRPRPRPLGYRTLLALALASEYYDDPDLPLRVVSRKQVYLETQLLAQFETGGLDAAFVYRNMAVERDYPYVELPPELNLGAPSMADRYATATVTLDDGTTFTGGPIAYGATLRTDRPAAQSVFETLVASTDDYLTDHGFVLRDAHPTYHGMFQTESIPETDRQTGWFVVGASLGVLLLLYYPVPLGRVVVRAVAGVGRGTARQCSRRVGGAQLPADRDCQHCPVCGARTAPGVLAGAHRRPREERRAHTRAVTAGVAAHRQRDAVTRGGRSERPRCVHLAVVHAVAVRVVLAQTFVASPFLW